MPAGKPGGIKGVVDAAPILSKTARALRGLKGICPRATDGLPDLA